MPTHSRPLLNMMEFAYRIRNWPEHFETSESRKIKGPLSWVALPTKHDGRGYKRATNHPHAVQALCGWWSLLQVAAKMPVHGLLADRDGPLDAEDIADKTGLPKKIYLTALDLMSGEKIGWLEKLDWDKTLDFAGNIAALVASQRLPAGALEYQRGSAVTSGHQRSKKARAIPANPSGHQLTQADTSASQRTPADDSGHQQTPADTSLHNRQDKTDIPPAVPQRGLPADNLIKSPEIAKRLICQKILGGKDPARAWSHQAMFRLSELCSPPGMPIQEIFDVAEFRAIAKSDDVPELKYRIDPPTETGLMSYWGDEVTRARAYLAKYRRNGSAPGENKPEPKRWQEFFRWKYGDNCELPSSYALLDDDQKREWEREHEEWESSAAGQPEEALKS
jgi:hypothetical protein